jgi:hypothetical protein
MVLYIHMLYFYQLFTTSHLAKNVSLYMAHAYDDYNHSYYVYFIGNTGTKPGRAGHTSLEQNLA